MNKTAFPRVWGWFFDEMLPGFVKNHYSPKENWKAKPFSRPDAIFFLKGIRELSDRFTDGRDQFRPGYFNHSKFRSSYLLYFLPLQAAKFLLLMDQHRARIELLLKESQKTGKLRVADLGAGPGTGSIAFLLYILGNFPDEIPESIEFTWFDEVEKMMVDGEKLVMEFAQNFRPLEGKVQIKMHVGDWKKHRFLKSESYDFSLFGHVLNEEKSFHQTDLLTYVLREWVERSGEGGALFIEPAFRASSQLLGKIRDDLVVQKEEVAPVLEDDEEDFLEDSLKNKKKLKVEKNLPISIIGPCLHEGSCPLAKGKDWCHFSVKAETPGKWFEFFSKGLSSQKEWIKYSYLWLKVKNETIKTKKTFIDPTLRLVLTDSLVKSLKGPQMYLLCEPDHPRRYTTSSGDRIRRGDVIKVSLTKLNDRPVKETIYED